MKNFRLWPILVGVLTSIVCNLAFKDPYVSTISGACFAALLVVIVHVIRSRK